MDKVNLSQKFEQICDYWNPHVAGELNGQQVKLAKVKGEFVWHSHEAEDELFFVVKGKLRLEFRDRVEELSEGEFCIVPAGTEHRPVANEEAWLMLFEPSGTLNTGNNPGALTRTVLKKI